MNKQHLKLEFMQGEPVQVSSVPTKQRGDAPGPYLTLEICSEGVGKKQAKLIARFLYELSHGNRESDAMEAESNENDDLELFLDFSDPFDTGHNDQHPI